MKVKNIKIAIKSDKELFNEVKEVWNKLEKGEKVKKTRGYFVYKSRCYEEGAYRRTIKNIKNN